MGNRIAALVARQLTEKPVPARKRARKNSAPLSISGTEGMVVNFPKCCLPIPGDPMLVGITMGLREDGDPKHTYQNAMASGDFVINVTTEAFRDQIEVVAIEGPADSDEFELTGWTPVPATKVTSPAIAEALARLECEVRQVVHLGTSGVPFGEVHLVVAKVVWVTYDEAICNERGRIDPLRLGAIGRLGLRSFLRTVEEGTYFLPRIPWAEFTASRDVPTGGR